MDFVRDDRDISPDIQGLRVAAQRRRGTAQKARHVLSASGKSCAASPRGHLVGRDARVARVSPFMSALWHFRGYCTAT